MNSSLFEATVTASHRKTITLIATRSDICSQRPKNDQGAASRQAPVDHAASCDCRGHRPRAASASAPRQEVSLCAASSLLSPAHVNRRIERDNRQRPPPRRPPAPRECRLDVPFGLATSSTHVGPTEAARDTRFTRGRRRGSRAGRHVRSGPTAMSVICWDSGVGRRKLTAGVATSLGWKSPPT